MSVLHDSRAPKELLNLDFNADPDSAFHFNADPDPAPHLQTLQGSSLNLQASSVTGLEPLKSF